MQQNISKGYAREVPFGNTFEEGDYFYIPHHAVIGRKRLRIVFDCRSEFEGQSLNKSLLSGPDLTCSLPGVLSRFRLEVWTLCADIEAMFYQIAVDPKFTHYLRFIWYQNGDMSRPPVDHEMLVHLFGSRSSPSIANFCLKQCVFDFGDNFDEDVSECVLRNFYVDDFLKSVESEDDALRISAQLRELLARAGFRLTKWISNSPKVLAALPEQEKAQSVLNFDIEGTITEKVLGIHWDVITDNFGFDVELEIPKLFTRRTILSFVAGLFDPLGFLAPVVIVAKTMQQSLCRNGLGWDTRLPLEDEDRWSKWLLDLKLLKGVRVPRCVKSTDFGEVIDSQIHLFADASSCAYAAVAYLRLTDSSGRVQCSFLMGKARVAPLKSVSIPRLELTAAVLAAKLDQLLRRELNVSESKSVFWSDSTAVLYSIRNSSKRFPVFVANRLAKIEECSDPSQWRHIQSSSNPADEASRGISAAKFVKSSKWLSPPDFLNKSEEFWPSSPSLGKIPQEFVPVKKQERVVCVISGEGASDRLIDRYSSLARLRNATAWILRFKLFLKMKARSMDVSKLVARRLTVVELQAAERQIAKRVQAQYFGKEIAILRGEGNSKSRLLKFGRPIAKLDPFLDSEGLLRVGGRLEKAPIEFDAKCPIILPSDGHFTELIVNNYHAQVGHSGLSHTLAAVRGRYWILKGSSAIRRVLSNCIPCRKRTAPRLEQIMADLPECRMKPYEPAFSHCGCDFFGPFLVKQGRSQVKRYGCIFTCLSSRAVHIEVTHSLSTDSFLGALRRFIGRRGKPKQIISDNGGCFVGAQRILRQEIKKLNSRCVDEYLKEREIEWSFNTPYASHMGGVYERLIRSIRKVLGSLLCEQVLTDEQLSSFMVETESILNSRPLIPVTLDPKDDEALTPNHLLLLRASPNLAPGEFDQKDCYGRSRWRQVQYLADQIWRRWTKEYLPTLTIRQKWTSKSPNLVIGDVCLIADDSQPRGKWSLGRVVETYPDRKGVVRQVSLKTSTGIWKRPIAKLCIVTRSAE